MDTVLNIPPAQPGEPEGVAVGGPLDCEIVPWIDVVVERDPLDDSPWYAPPHAITGPVERVAYRPETLRMRSRSFRILALSPLDLDDAALTIAALAIANAGDLARIEVQA